MQLLTTSNPKTQKGVKRGYLTAILHLAPSKLSGVDVCKHATPQCIRFCLNKAGRGGIVKKGETTNAIQLARVARTKFWLDNPVAFTAQLNKEIDAHKRKAEKLGLKPAVRLNGTSDISWENYLPALFWRHDDVQFYDYTKNFVRMTQFLVGSWVAKNYHLTFSRSELNDSQCYEVLRNGGSVAIVFDSVPSSFRDRPVLNGDDDDLRFLDGPEVWVGLKAKGKLKQFESTFKVMA
jgi:hypothetical protein